jgi:hypothetical protein
MADRTRLPVAAALTAVLALATGCGGGGGGGGDGGGGGGGGTGDGPPIGAVVPEFDLADDNPASPTYATLVSPSDVLGSASAWYFGHST